MARRSASRGGFDSHALPPGGEPAIPGKDAAESPDWAAYYRHTLGREPRPLFLRGLRELEAADTPPGQAVEIGYGDGTEVLALLDRGWRVMAIDPTAHAAAVLRERVTAEVADRLEIQTSRAEEATIPPFDLLYAGYALSFIDPAVFPSVWRRVRESLRPGGWLVVNVFGVHDTWAGDPAMTFLDLPSARRLVRGLDAVSFLEEDQDGDSFGGPKHWHLFDIVARRRREPRR